ncbi:malate:quinone oxidoreductase [Barrientosiimonas marina]|uniref:Probable malate:quinone oxidoreductase n=1 Tax=Lentibacillus kimchii TaxID=1542911 RepID=A0ABW2UV29_9BACI
MSNRQTSHDVILIGAGIMSATLGSIIKQLAPDWNITIFEKLDKPGEESTNVWNNSGTGHSALCELNYTPEQPDGSIDISKALSVNEKFQVSRQFWSYLVNQQFIENPRDFIRTLPHMSLVNGEDDVNFLKKRHEALTDNPLFEGMEFSDDPETLKEWLPLMMEDRTVTEPIAATKVDSGTDIDFGVLTGKLLTHLNRQNVNIRYNHTVDDIQRADDGSWEVKVRNFEDDTLEYHTASFVFIGGGGLALPLLQKTGIPESKHVGGFPVSGQFLVCQDPEVVKDHEAKVYTKAGPDAPPMSTPHLDARYIDGQKTLLFGPFAGFSPKFLKTGSYMDLLNSVKPGNVFTMLAGGAKNAPLTKYLIQQVLLTKKQRIEALREFVPDADGNDWNLITAGQRVQVIKDTKEDGKGTLQFGTELVHSADGSIAALLGASPGASTAVSIMLDMIEACFPEYLDEWEPKIREMIPSYGMSLEDDPELVRDIRRQTSEALNLTEASKAGTE